MRDVKSSGRPPPFAVTAYLFSGAWSKRPPRCGRAARGFTLAELARDCLRRAGKPARHGHGRPRVHHVRLPSILADAAPEPCWPGASEGAETYSNGRARPRRRTSASIPARQLESFPTLDRVNEDSEYTHGAISDRGAVFSVATWEAVQHFPSGRHQQRSEPVYGNTPQDGAGKPSASPTSSTACSPARRTSRTATALPRRPQKPADGGGHFRGLVRQGRHRHGHAERQRRQDAGLASLVP